LLPCLSLPLQKAERLKQSLHFIGLAPQNKHTVFVDSAKEAAAFKPAKFFDTPAELLGRSYNRPRNAQLQQQQQPAVDPAVVAKAEK
jgi:U3 small nucleolar RNA-associated protein 11